MNLTINSKELPHVKPRFGELGGGRVYQGGTLNLHSFTQLLEPNLMDMSAAVKPDAFIRLNEITRYMYKFGSKKETTPEQRASVIAYALSLLNLIYSSSEARLLCFFKESRNQVDLHRGNLLTMPRQ